ncbi:hypothetical protein PACTADRAFT_16666, partial [Pachysolen tannophilus NRRL Y-2460]
MDEDFSVVLEMMSGRLAHLMKRVNLPLDNYKKLKQKAPIMAYFCGLYSIEVLLEALSLQGSYWSDEEIKKIELVADTLITKIGSFKKYILSNQYLVDLRAIEIINNDVNGERFVASYAERSFEKCNNICGNGDENGEILELLIDTTCYYNVLKDLFLGKNLNDSTIISLNQVEEKIAKCQENISNFVKTKENDPIISRFMYKYDLQIDEPISSAEIEQVIANITEDEEVETDKEEHKEVDLKHDKWWKKSQAGNSGNSPITETAASIVARLSSLSPSSPAANSSSPTTSGPTTSEPMTVKDIEDQLKKNELLAQASKCCKFAISALSYEDCDTALNELQEAIHLIQNFKSTI